MTGVLRVNPKDFIGRSLGAVTILSVLGSGNAATVFLGFQHSLRRRVAVKVLPKTSHATALSSEYFRQEAELVGQLSHANIIPIHEAGEEHDCFFQVMPAIRGEDVGSLLQRLRRNPVPSRQVLALDTAINIIAQVLDGLAYAHEEGVIHRDIKPANIMLERKNSRPLIADFGIARTKWSAMPPGDKIEGTPLYMAPEHVQGKSADHRIDLYAVGVMLYQSIAGDLPLVEREPMALLGLKYRDPEAIFSGRPSQVSSRINASMERIILTAISPDPSERYQSGAEFRDELLWYRRHYPTAGHGDHV
jgi:serine/threonine-protein kinase